MSFKIIKHQFKMNDNFFVKSFNKIIFDIVINKHLDHKCNINHPKMLHI
jgi:hypothetical protein